MRNSVKSKLPGAVGSNNSVRERHKMFSGTKPVYYALNLILAFQGDLNKQLINPSGLTLAKGTFNFVS